MIDLKKLIVMLCITSCTHLPKIGGCALITSGPFKGSFGKVTATKNNETTVMFLKDSAVYHITISDKQIDHCEVEDELTIEAWRIEF